MADPRDHPTTLRRPKALVVGSPNVDTMAFVSDALLSEHGLPKGDATPIQDGIKFEAVKAAAAKASQERGTTATVGSGGCATNAGKALAGCGIDTSVCGKVGNDPGADTFRGKLKATRVQDATLASEHPTGEVLCLVTDDGERTFAYRSGASASLESPELLSTIGRLHTSESALSIVYFDIYVMLCPGAVLEEALEKCQDLNIETALNLGSVSIVRDQKHRIWPALERGLVQVLTLNYEEATELVRERPEASDDSATDQAVQVISKLAPFCGLVVMTMGIQGVLVGGKAVPLQRFEVTPVEKVVDSTGAGDFYAGGFLAGYIQEKPLETCHRWGSLTSSEVVQVLSTDMDDAAWGRIASKMAVS